MRTTQFKCALHRRSPISEVLSDLLPAINDGVEQIAGLVLGETLGPQLRIVRLACDWQLGNWKRAHHRAIISQVDVVAGIALLRLG